MDRKQLEEILDLAKWAPSGDNEQNWKFEIHNDGGLIIHGYDIRHLTWLDFKGKASHLALGGLLENLSIAAAEFGYQAHYDILLGQPEEKPLIQVDFQKLETSFQNPLFPYIKTRETNRNLYAMKNLSNEIKEKLSKSLEEPFKIKFYDSFSDKRAFARRNYYASKIRMLLPEVFEEMNRIIDWDHELSVDRLAAKSLGMNPISRNILKWALQSKQRFWRFMKLPCSLSLSLLEVDYIPSIVCGAHFLIYSNSPLKDFEMSLEAGRSIQRFWLTAAKEQLSVHPSYTSINLINYHNRLHDLTLDETLYPLIEKQRKIQESISSDIDLSQLVFSGRIGYGKEPYSRSIRKSLQDLLINH